MTLTTLQAFQRYSELTWYQKVFVKRYIPSTDTYESEWQDISDYLIKNTVQSISKQLPQDNYSYGSVVLDNCSFEFRNIYGELSDETNDNSVFLDYQRHNSLVKVQEGYVDRTDDNNRVNIEQTSFVGLIDDLEAVTTKNYTEKFRAKDRLKVLEQITKKDLGAIAATSINAFVYEAMNRTAVTKYGITINSGTAYINAGYNATSCDFSQYGDDETVLEILQNLATGHSIFYIDPSTDYFHFKAITPTVSTIVTFEDIIEKRIQIDNYSTGADKVIENWYWDSTNLSSPSQNVKYKTSETMNIKAVTNTVQRQALLDYVRGQTETPKLNFDILLPYFPVINILDRVKVDKKGAYPQDAFILGVGRLGTDRLRRPVGAVALSPTVPFYIRGIKHSKQQTTISVQTI